MKVLPRFMLLGIVLTAVVAMAHIMVTQFTGTESLSGPPSGGTVFCPDGQPTGQFPFGPPCTQGRVQIRNVVFPYVLQATDPRMEGNETVIVNANWDGWTQFGPGSGPMWGTLVLQGSAGPWEGVWTGQRVVRADGGHSHIRVIAFGTNGTVEGMKADWEIAYTPASPNGKSLDGLSSAGSEHAVRETASGPPIGLASMTWVPILSRFFCSVS